MATAAIAQAGATPAEHAAAPAFSDKFRKSKAQEIIASVIKAKLGGAVYHPDNASAWSREIADEVKQKLKAQGWPRYKIVVQAFIGEQRGEGCRMSCRCFWDSSSDSYAHETFSNASIFAVVVAFGLYTP